MQHCNVEHESVLVGRTNNNNVDYVIDIDSRMRRHEMTVRYFGRLRTEHSI